MEDDHEEAPAETSEEGHASETVISTGPPETVVSSSFDDVEEPTPLQLDELQSDVAGTGNTVEEVLSFLDVAELATFSVSRKRKLESLNAESEAKLTAAESKIDALQRKQTDLEQELHQLRGEKRQANESIESLERRLRDLQAEQVRETGRLLEAQQAVQREAAMREQVHGQLRFVESERAALQQQLAERDRQLAALQKEKDTATAESVRVRSELLEPLQQARQALASVKREAEQRRFAQQKELDTLRAQCDALRREADRSRTRCEQQAAETADLQEQLQETRARLRQAQRTEAIMGSLEADTLVPALKGELEHYKAKEAEYAAAQQELQRQRAMQLNSELLQEQIVSLQADKQRAQQVYAELLEAQRQLAALDLRRSKWERCEVLDEFTDAEHLRLTLADLRRASLLLSDKSGAASAELAAARQSLERLRLELDEIRAEHSRTKHQAEHATESLIRQDRQLALLKRERDGLKSILESYTAEDALLSGHDAQKVRRIQELEALLAAREQHAGQLEQLLRVRNAGEAGAAMVALQQQNAQLEHETQRLRLENERLAAEVASLDHRVGRGDYNPASTKVLHMKYNPEARATEGKSPDELERLRRENESLRAQVVAAAGDASKGAAGGGAATAAGGGTRLGAPAPTAVVLVAEQQQLQQQQLQQQQRSSDELDALRKKHVRVKEAFQKKFQEYRDVIRHLFGWTVDITTMNKYRLRSIYAEQESDHLMFQQAKQDQLELLETEFSLQLGKEVATFLTKCRSIPAFLANVTTMLFEKTTFSLGSNVM